MTAARSEGPSTRHRMLDVAETHFARKGYEGARLESIATEVGVRKTALYYYFDSKSVLYGAVLERMSTEFRRVLMEALASPGDHIARLELLLSRLNELLAHKPAYAQILLRIFVDRIPVDASVIDPTLRDARARLLDFYAEGVSAGAFRDASPQHFIMSLLGIWLFHYGSGASSATALGVEDIFSDKVAAWSGAEFRDVILNGVRADRP